MNNQRKNVNSVEIAPVGDQETSLRMVRLSKSYPQVRHISSLINEAIYEQDRDQEMFMGHVSRVVSETFSADRFTLQLHREVALKLMCRVLKLCVKAILCMEPKALTKIKEADPESNQKSAS